MFERHRVLPMRYQLGSVLALLRLMISSQTFFQLHDFNLRPIQDLLVELLVGQRYLGPIQS